MEKKKELEERIQSYIVKLSNTDPKEKDKIDEYQRELCSKIEEWRTKYEIDYKHRKRLNGLL